MLAPKTDTATMIDESVGRFCERHVDPFYEDWERAGNVPRDLWRLLGEAGFLNADVPEQAFGHGGDYELFAAIIEAFSRRGYATIASPMIGVHSGIVAHYLVNNGTAEQKERYLPGMASGEIVGAIGMSEPAAGSDLQGIKTRAVKDGDDWLISGQKTFISNGQHCDFVIVVARSNPDAPGSRGTSLFIVDTDAAGFARGRNLDKIGLHSADTSELFFDDVRVPSSAMLGGQDQGFIVLMSELPRERLLLANIAIAAVEGMLQDTHRYITERQAFGAPLSKLQTIRHAMAQMLTEAKVTRAFMDHCMAALADGALDTATASMAKMNATELQFSIADRCLQLHGGYGYMAEYPISRAFVDARSQRIYGGTSEIMKEIIAKSWLGG